MMTVLEGKNTLDVLYCLLTGNQLLKIDKGQILSPETWKLSDASVV